MYRGRERESERDGGRVGRGRRGSRRAMGGKEDGRKRESQEGGERKDI